MNLFSLYLHFIHFAFRPALHWQDGAPDVPLELCSSGPYPNEQWVERSARALASIARTVSRHYYGCEPRYTGEDADREEYLHSLSSVEKVRRLIREMRRQLATVKEDVLMDQDQLVFVDLAEGLTHRQRYTALFFHMLMEESGSCSVSIACHFQAVNEGLITVTPEEGALPAAEGQVFRALSHHAGGRLLSVSPNHAVTKRADGTVTASVVNASWDESLPVRLGLPEDSDCAEADLLTGDSVLPPSRFREEDVREEVRAGAIVLPPHSVLLLRFTPKNR